MPEGQSDIERSVSPRLEPGADSSIEDSLAAPGAGPTDAPSIVDGGEGVPAPRVRTGTVDELTAMPESVQFDDGERPARVLAGTIGLGVAIVAFLVAVLALLQVFRPMPQGSQFYLIIFLAGTLPLVFLVYRSGVELPARWRRHHADTDAEGAAPGTARRARRERPTLFDWVLAAVALLVCLYPLAPVAVAGGGGGWDAFLNRQGQLVPFDVVMGGVLLLLVIEACRRTTGWVLPVVCLVLLGYGYYGGFLPQNWVIAHEGLDFSQIIDALYNSGSGFYGTPLDVAATYIVLFTIYGAVLDLSGAGQFFVDLSVAAFKKSRSAPGRTVVASGFLLGTVSGSGTATAVSIGAATWPILRRAGYPPDHAGGMLAASGVGAILSPPTLGAAAFIVAEYLDVSYLRVLGWATIPTVLYYLGILLAVEIDVRKHGLRAVHIKGASFPRLVLRFGYHFSSLVMIVVLLALGMSTTRAVVYATIIAFLLSFLDRRGWLTPRRLFEALSSGIRGVLPVVAVCTAAGIITATATKTGLGTQMTELLVSGAKNLAGNPTIALWFTVFFAAIALLILGLAVPVTASFIIGWVIVGPALLNLGVGAPAAAMFVFYYSVLSEVTPPTALAAVGSAAITGGRPMATMWQAFRYALPAFLAPIAFVITKPGAHLLGLGTPVEVLTATVAACLGISALAIVTGGWVLGIGPAGPIPRVIAAASGVLLLYMEPVPVAVGAVLLTVAVVVTVLQRRRAAERGSVQVPAADQWRVVTGQRPAGERPTGQRPTGERPTGQRPTGERPTGERPAGERQQSVAGGPRTEGGEARER